MKYENVLTGARIETTSVILGGGWRPVEEKKPAKKPGRKKKTDEDLRND